MPTKHTEQLYEGIQDQTVEDFILGCARDLIPRGYVPDGQLQRTIEPSIYRRQQIHLAKETIEALEAISTEDLAERLAQEYERAHGDYLRRKAETVARQLRYSNMIEAVKALDLPEAYSDLKTHALTQLLASMAADCIPPGPPALTVDAELYRTDQLERLRSELASYEQILAEDEAALVRRNAWTGGLFDALKIHTPPEGGTPT